MIRKEGNGIPTIAPRVAIGTLMVVTKLIALSPHGRGALSLGESVERRPSHREK